MKTSVQHLIVDSGSSDRRLDNFLMSTLPKIPHSRIYNIIRTGQVRVNGSRAKPKQRIQVGDNIRVPPINMENAPSQAISPDQQMLHAAQQVLFEDEFMVALDKPAGITVHGGTRHSYGLIEAIRNIRSDTKFLELAHRLDKDTSGILILCKDRLFLRELHNLWLQKSHESLIKNYTALLDGKLAKRVYRVELEETSRHMNSRMQGYKQIKRPSIHSLSEIAVERRLQHCTLVDVLLKTGRTHQARRHAKHIGHPIAGDKRYGDRQFNDSMRKRGLKRMFLHASRLRVVHPRTNQLVDIKSRLPTELTEVLNQLHQS